jgi:hypothetical protein
MAIANYSQQYPTHDRMEYNRNRHRIQGVISLERNFILVYHDLWNFDFRFAILDLTEQVLEKALSFRQQTAKSS